MDKKQFTPMFRSLLKRNLRYTTNKNLAIEMSKGTNKAPIEFISPKLRATYLKAYPELKIIINE